MIATETYWTLAERLGHHLDAQRLRRLDGSVPVARLMRANISASYVERMTCLCFFECRPGEHPEKLGCTEDCLGFGFAHCILRGLGGLGGPMKWGAPDMMSTSAPGLFLTRAWHGSFGPAVKLEEAAESMLWRPPYAISKHGKWSLKDCQRSSKAGPLRVGLSECPYTSSELLPVSLSLSKQIL